MRTISFFLTISLLLSSCSGSGSLFSSEMESSRDYGQRSVPHTTGPYQYMPSHTVDDERNEGVPCGIIIGLTGGGKTSLANKICGVDMSVSEGGVSTTRGLYSARARFENHIFDLVDSPGTETSDEVVKLAITLYKGLTTQPYNGVFAVVEYHSKPHIIVDEYLKLIRLISFSNNNDAPETTMIVVNKFDYASEHLAGKERQEDMNRIENNVRSCFLDAGIKNKIIFTSSLVKKLPNIESEDLYYEDVAKELFGFLRKGSKKLLQINQEEFLAIYKISDKSTLEGRFAEQATYKLRSLSKEYEDLMDYSKTHEECELFAQLLMVCLKRDLDEESQNYLNQVIDKEGLVYYCLKVDLQGETMVLHRNFTKKARSVLGYDFFGSIRNTVKKCPHCGIYFAKVEGCDGETTCGAVPASKNEFRGDFLRYWKYIVSRINGRLQITKNKNYTELPSSRKNSTSVCTSARINRQKDLNGKNNIGCGKSIVWSQIPPLSEKEVESFLSFTSNHSLKGTVDEVVKKTFMEEVCITRVKPKLIVKEEKPKFVMHERPKSNFTLASSVVNLHSSSERNNTDTSTEDYIKLEKQRIEFVNFVAEALDTSVSMYDLLEVINKSNAELLGNINKYVFFDASFSVNKLYAEAERSIHKKASEFVKTISGFCKNSKESFKLSLFDNYLFSVYGLSGHSCLELSNLIDEYSSQMIKITQFILGYGGPDITSIKVELIISAMLVLNRICTELKKQNYSASENMRGSENELINKLKKVEYSRYVIGTIKNWLDSKDDHLKIELLDMNITSEEAEKSNLVKQVKSSLEGFCSMWLKG